MPTLFGIRLHPEGRRFRSDLVVEGGPWLTVVPDADGTYVIPAEEVTDR